MKRSVRKEIYIEIETIRVTRTRRIRKNETPKTSLKSQVPSHRSEYLFDLGLGTFGT